MEHLTKQQIILLALLVSFVTSIATGIVTVSLINQAPAGTTNTIERVIEDGVAATLPSDNVASIVQSGSTGDSLTAAIDIVRRSIVQISGYGSTDSVLGLGIVVNAGGSVMTDRSVIADLNDVGITYPDGKTFHGAVVESQTNGDIVFLDPIASVGQATSSSAFVPVSLAPFPRLGEVVASLGGADAGVLGIGVVDSTIASDASSTPSAVSTTIGASKAAPGSPLFDINGSLIGMQTISLVSASSTEFYLVASIKAAIPK